MSNYEERFNPDAQKDAVARDREERFNPHAERRTLVKDGSPFLTIQTQQPADRISCDDCGDRVTAAAWISGGYVLCANCLQRAANEVRMRTRTWPKEHTA